MRTVVYEDALNEVLIGNTFAAPIPPIPRDGESRRLDRHWRTWLRERALTNILRF